VVTHKNQRSVEVLVILLNIVRVIPSRLPLVHCVEVETSVVILDGLEERSESVSEAVSVQRLETQHSKTSDTALRIDFQRWRVLLVLFTHL